MKVKELIEQLQKFDQDMEVCKWESGGAMDMPGYNAEIYEVEIRPRRADSPFLAPDLTEVVVID